jgi:hypothetical protein
MSEQRFLERLREGVKSYLNPLHGTDDCLLFMIDENVKPRDTGTLMIVCAGKVLCEIPNLALYNSDPEPVIRRLKDHAKALQSCAAQRIEFRNVSPWLEGEIRKTLNSLLVPVAAS